MKKEKLEKRILLKLNLNENKPIIINDWNKFLKNLENPKEKINIALIGKYVELRDAYKSITESLIHAGVKSNCNINLVWISSGKINNKNVYNKLKQINADLFIVIAYKILPKIIFTLPKYLKFLDKWIILYLLYFTNITELQKY